MNNAFPVVLWYGGLLGCGLAALLLLWAIAVYALKQATGRFAAGLMSAGVVLAAGSAWAVTESSALKRENQVLKVHDLLMRFAAGSVTARRALDDVRAAAQPSAALTDLQAKYDTHETSIENLLQAEWAYQRGGPWDERALLHKTTWGLHDVLLHHARWEKRPEALECPATPPVAPLSDLTTRLQQHLQNQKVLATAITEQFEGYDLESREATGSEGATKITLAIVFGALALTAVAAAVVVRRKRPGQTIDVLVVASAVLLIGVAAWLALDADTGQERLRGNFFDRSVTVYREVIDLNGSLEALALAPRDGVLQPRDTPGQVIADYTEYVNAARGLALLVRLWDQAVLTESFDPSLLSTEKIETHDDLVNAVRTRMMELYRRYVQIDRRVTELSCRSQWFVRDSNRTREDELVTLP